MSLTILDGGLATQDASDESTYDFDWDERHLADGVTVASSSFRIEQLSGGITKLAADLAAGVGTMTVRAGYGSQFRVGTYVLISADGDGADAHNDEVVLVTAIAVDVVTVNRAQLGTVDGDHAAGAMLGTQPLLKSDESIGVGSRITNLQLSAGRRGALYKVMNKVRTSETPAQTKERDFLVRIK